MAAKIKGQYYRVITLLCELSAEAVMLSRRVKCYSSIDQAPNVQHQIFVNVSVWK